MILISIRSLRTTLAYKFQLRKIGTIFRLRLKDRKLQWISVGNSAAIEFIHCWLQLYFSFLRFIQRFVLRFAIQFHVLFRNFGIQSSRNDQFTFFIIPFEWISAHSSVLHFQFSVTYRFWVLNSVSVNLFCAQFRFFQSSEFARFSLLVFNSAIVTNGLVYEK